MRPRIVHVALDRRKPCLGVAIGCLGEWEDAAVGRVQGLGDAVDHPCATEVEAVEMGQFAVRLKKMDQN